LEDVCQTDDECNDLALYCHVGDRPGQCGSKSCSEDSECHQTDFCNLDTCDTCNLATHGGERKYCKEGKICNIEYKCEPEPVVVEPECSVETQDVDCPELDEYCVEGKCEL
jgi:hypothetical protein